MRGGAEKSLDGTEQTAGVHPPHRPSFDAVCDNCGASQGSDKDTQHCGECGALQGADEEQEMEECDALEAEQSFGQTRSQPPAAEARIVREGCQPLRHLAERVTPPTADWEDRVASPLGGGAKREGHHRDGRERSRTPRESRVKVMKGQGRGKRQVRGPF